MLQLASVGARTVRYSFSSYQAFSVICFICRAFVRNVNRKSYYFRLGCNRIRIHTRKCWQYSNIGASNNEQSTSRTNNQYCFGNKKVPEEIDWLSVNKWACKTNAYVNNTGTNKEEYTSCAYSNCITVRGKLKLFTNTHAHAHAHAHAPSNHFSSAIVVAIIKLFRISVNSKYTHIYTHAVHNYRQTNAINSIIHFNKCFYPMWYATTIVPTSYSSENAIIFDEIFWKFAS